MLGVLSKGDPNKTLAPFRRQAKAKGPLPYLSKRANLPLLQKKCFNIPVKAKRGAMRKKQLTFIFLSFSLFSCSPATSSTSDNIIIGPDSPVFNFPYGDALKIEGRLFVRDGLKPVEPPSNLPLGKADNFLIGDKDFTDYVEKTIPWSGTYYIYDQTVRDFENAKNNGELMMYFFGDFDEATDFYLYQDDYYGGNGLYRYMLVEKLPEHMTLTTVIDIQTI